MTTADRIPVTIVTGFLGSGKTTLINHVLSRAGLGRVAALVNDFGAINIDAALISSIGRDVVQLSNGCICCSINDDLFGAAQRVLAMEPRIDRIVVETTGLADPLPVGLTFLRTELRPRTLLDGVITVADAADFALDLFRGGVALSQIVHADLVILNKTDLVDEDRTASLRRRIAILKPQARILEATYGQVPLAAVFGPEPGALRHRFTCDEGGPDPVDGFQAHSFHLTGAFAAPRFQDFLDTRPQQIFRAKGIIRFAGQDTPSLFQLCGARVSFDPFAEPADDNRLVFIGRDLDRGALETRLGACLQPS